MTVQNKQYELSTITKEIVISQPFYGLLLLNINKLFTNCGTARAVLRGINYSLEFDPTFWDTLTNKHKEGLLLHEILHIAHFHLTEYGHLTDGKIANIAMDIEINQKIHAELLPPGGCTLDKFLDQGLLPNEGTNMYYKKLKEACENDPALDKALHGEPGSGQQLPGSGEPITLPDHDWKTIEEASESIKQLLTKQTVSMIDSVVKEVTKQRGVVPHDIVELLERLSKLEPPKFNWKAYLRRFVGYSCKTFVKKTKRKQSKRFIHDHGLRVDSLSRIFWVIDSSASVSDAEIKEIINEMHHANKCGHEIVMTFADTSMQTPFKFNPAMEIKMEKRGGTDFNEAVDYYIKHKSKFSAMVYLTDGEAPAPKNTPKNTLWVLTSISQPCDHLPGRIIKLN